MLSPSPMIDKVWHMHILDTRSYKRYCDDKAGHFIHHDPDGGLDVEARRRRIETTKIAVQARYGRDSLYDNVWDFGNCVGVKVKSRSCDDVVGDDQEESERGRRRQRQRREANGSISGRNTRPLIRNDNNSYGNDGPSKNLDDRQASQPIVDPTLPHRYFVIHIHTHNEAGEVVSMRVKRTTRLDAIMKKYAEEVGVACLNSLRVLYGGFHVPFENGCSAGDLDMEDGDIIDVFSELSGC
eukprot:CAMPEP_0196804820 /NCGR_PEP_ID=MMETSP1362-20130617/4492_1 /TAXON_ID=163516 /ORGANISM="Leptocylindrus danicus, Strain CCMP1856" /LENGTH=239 /DNA_ID=CAMNT_0042177341 /DNA_START=121 /DNA_END=840 /DNA_ORIENTATION=-